MKKYEKIVFDSGGADLVFKDGKFYWAYHNGVNDSKEYEEIEKQDLMDTLLDLQKDLEKTVKRLDDCIEVAKIIIRE